ncbi:unnamed protein product [Gulo gulo]|uniref:Uncharacterized protein n=1 Tax=Gulo gulo TaxID=48420 RepID=A0A9X9PXS7_GULGU|nr:unnamed protein product [Gulo gulo]
MHTLNQLLQSRKRLRTAFVLLSIRL